MAPGTKVIMGSIVLGMLASGAACGRAAAPPPSPAPAAAEPFAPGLGELMTFQQLRHTKLWLAAKAGNWPLASYEVDELGEGFDDIVKFHPTHKDSPVAIKDVVPTMVMVPLDEVRKAVDAKDLAAFTTAYDHLTAGCNSCHEATNFGFNRVQRPSGANPYPNQVFEPVPHGRGGT